MLNPPTADILGSEVTVLPTKDKSVFHLTECLEDDLMKSWKPPKAPLLHSPDRIQLEQSLDSKAARLKILEKEVNALRMEIAKDQVTLSPIRLLPPEILSRILCIAAKGNWDDVEFQLHSRSAKLWSYSENIVWVCKEWRSLAMSTPSFWSHINLSSISVGSFRHSLAHSMEASLHLLMFRYNKKQTRNATVPTTGTSKSRSLIMDLSIVLAPHRKRVKTFGEAGQRSIFLETASIPADIGDNSWDNLQHLRLDRSTSNPRNVLSATIPGLLAFPQLLSLSIRYHSFIQLPRFICPILKSLTLLATVSSFEELYQVVEHCPALIELMVSVGYNEDDTLSSPSNDLIERFRLTLSNVKSLEVMQYYSVWPYHAMWSCCPSLETFVIHNGYQFIPPSLDRTLINPSVRTFILHTTQRSAFWPTPHVANFNELFGQCWNFWLNAFPALHHITMTSINDSDQQYDIRQGKDITLTATLLDSLTHTQGKGRTGGPKGLFAPQLMEVCLEKQDVDILPLFSFAKGRLPDFSGRFDRRLSGTSANPNVVPIVLKLMHCDILHMDNTTLTTDPWDAYDVIYRTTAPVNLSLTTFQDLDSAITITPYPELGPDGWTFEFPITFMPEDCKVIIEPRVMSSEPKHV